MPSALIRKCTCKKVCAYCAPAHLAPPRRSETSAMHGRQRGRHEARYMRRHARWRFRSVSRCCAGLLPLPHGGRRAAQQRRRSGRGRSTSRTQAPTGDDFLPPEKAFRFSASADGTERVRLDWVIAPGYYLYRDRIKIADDARARSAHRVSRRARSRRTSTSASRWSTTSELIVPVPVERKPAGATTAALTRHLSGLRRGRPVLSAHDSYRAHLTPRLPAAGQAAAPAAAPPLAAPAAGSAAPAATCPSRTAWRHCSLGQHARGAAANSSSAACCWPLRPACCPWCRFSRA